MKTNALFNYLSLLGILLCSASCQHTLYVPNKANAPLLEKKGDITVSAGIHLIEDNTDATAYEVQTAFALGNNFAFMINGDLVQDNSKKILTTAPNYHLLEAGLGYYTAFPLLEADGKDGRFNIFAGVGNGRIYSLNSSSYWYNPDSLLYKGRFRKLFIQSSIGIKSKYVDVVTGGRFSFLDYHNWQDINADPSVYNRNLKHSTIEAFSSIRLGYDWVKLYFDLGLMMPFRKDDTYSDYGWYLSSLTAYLGTGITFYISTL